MDADTLRREIESGLDLDATKPSGRSMLMDCAIMGLDAHAQILIDAGADPNLLTSDDQRLLSDDGGVMTALMLAITNGQENCAMVLCASSADKTTEINGFTPLSLACAWGMPGVVKMLIEAGVDISRTIAEDESSINDDTPAMIAADIGNIECLQLLIDAGADISLANFLGNTALHLAAINNHYRCVVALIRAGGNIDAESKVYFTALDYAAMKSSLPCVSHLLRAGAKIDRAIWSAIRSGECDRRVMRRFIKAGFDVNNINIPGRKTLLLHAIEFGANNTVDDLLEDFGCDPNIPNINGVTPLMKACEKSNSMATLMLIDHGAAIDAADAKGTTAMMIAMRKGATICVDFLIGAGAKLPSFEFGVKLLTDKRLAAHTAGTFMDIISANKVPLEQARDAIKNLDSAGARKVRPLIEAQLLPKALSTRVEMAPHI